MAEHPKLGKIETPCPRPLNSVNRVALEEMQKPMVKGPGNRTKLDKLQVKDILRDPRTAQEIADEYEVSVSLIHNIKQGRAFAYFEDVDEERWIHDPETGGLVNPRYPNELAMMEVVVHPRGRTPTVDDDTLEKIRSDDRTITQIWRHYNDSLEFKISKSTIWRIKHGEYCNRGAEARAERGDRILAVVGGKPIFDRKRKYVRQPREKQQTEA